jgi:3-oxoacyl-[acyl-carrier-protein] synthase II
MAKRVVITGMGTVNALGNNLNDFWAGIKAGRSGVDRISQFDPKDHSTKIAAEVKDFNPSEYMDPKDARKMERFSHFAVASAIEAYKDAGLNIENVDRERLGVILGVGMGGFGTLEESFQILHDKGPQRLPPLCVPKIISNIGPGNIAIILKAEGPSYSMATACASGTDAIGHAFRMIRDDVCDAVITGGVEAIVTPLGIAAFNALHALSTKYNDMPQKASRPFDRNRDGFVMGEGAGVLILEDLEHAQARGAKIYAEVIGSGSSTDAYHMTAPHPEGRGAIQAVKAALRVAGLQPGQVDYINAHGTSTEINDSVETKVIKSVFGDHARKLKVSSTKSMTGHCIGAAGAIEAIICAMALKDQFYPATINLENPDPECDLDYVPNQGINAPMEVAMSNSLGFGGHNGILVLRRWKD